MATIYQRYLDAIALQRKAKDKGDASKVAKARTPSKATNTKKLVNKLTKQGKAKWL